MIRQNASTSPAVLIRILDVLTAVVSAERDLGRMMCLKEHADLVAAMPAVIVQRLPTFATSNCAMRPFWKCSNMASRPVPSSD